MKIINTLGPKQTDSYKAAQFLASKEKIEVKLHTSFDDIYNHLADLKGEYMLVPVAYRSAVTDGNWVDNNYRYFDQLKIIDTFMLPTMPMILVQNQQQHNQSIVLHPSTTAFLDGFQSERNLALTRDYVSNKPLALKKFLSGNYEYAIISEKWLEDARYKGISGDDFRTIKRYSPDMIWCLYKIIGK